MSGFVSCVCADGKCCGAPHLTDLFYSRLGSASLEKNLSPFCSRGCSTVLAALVQLCPVSPSTSVKPQGNQQEQTFLSPSAGSPGSLRIGTCFSVGGEDACVWDEQAKLQSPVADPGTMK